MIRPQTHLQDDHCLAKEAEGKSDGLASMSPRPKPMSICGALLKWKVEERNVPNIHQLRDVIMDEWKRIPVATCEAVVNSMPKRVKG